MNETPEDFPVLTPEDEPVPEFPEIAPVDEPELIENDAPLDAPDPDNAKVEGA